MRSIAIRFEDCATFVLEHMDTPTLLRLATTLVLALENDPFYRALTPGVTQEFDRRPLLHDYFAHSLRGCVARESVTRCVHSEDGRSGVALWMLPDARHTPDGKADFVRDRLGSPSSIAYESMLRVMGEKAQTLVPPNAWYLSIIGVEPRMQGQGIGRKLLEPTLAEAAACAAPCYLETFSEQALMFYRQLGFEMIGSQFEPTAQARYWLMLKA